MNVIVSNIETRTFFIRGRISNLMCNPDSNIYKFFNPINKAFTRFIDLINYKYIGLYPCKSTTLLREHEDELGIPDGIFNNQLVNNGFPYIFDLPFYDIVPVDDVGNRRLDVITKKYLMDNNTINNIIRIGSHYGVCVEVIDDNIPKYACGFPYTFANDGDGDNGAMIFCGYEDWVDPCKFTYTFGDDVINSDDEMTFCDDQCYDDRGILYDQYYTFDKKTNQLIVITDRYQKIYNGLKTEYDNVVRVVYINIYNADDILFHKLNRIYKAMQPLGLIVRVENKQDLNVNCDILEFC